MEIDVQPKCVEGALQRRHGRRRFCGVGEEDDQEQEIRDI